MSLHRQQAPQVLQHQGRPRMSGRKARRPQTGWIGFHSQDVHKELNGNEVFLRNDAKLVWNMNGNIIWFETNIKDILSGLISLWHICKRTIARKNISYIVIYFIYIISLNGHISHVCNCLLQNRQVINSSIRMINEAMFCGHFFCRNAVN